MSLTSTQPTVSSDTSSFPTSTDVGNTSDGGGGRTTDFFGFLIAFVALALVFMVCGVGSRRRFVARRAAMLDADPWAFSPPVRQTEPKYWEPSLLPGDGLEWSTIMPLSVSALHGNVNEEDHTRRVPRTPPRAFSLLPLSSWIPFVRANAGAPGPHGKLPESSRGHETEKPPDDLEVQVEVIVKLPSAPRSFSDEELNRERLPEYQIGSARVLWQGGSR